ncbi:MAG: septum site-determining protein MinC [Carboxydocellales bacterium]
MNRGTGIEKEFAGTAFTREPEFEDLADEATVLIKRTLRSGQSIHYHGNVVVLGDVNPGAEIVAGGNIIVMGSLRGVVHAGATGAKDAEVTAFRLLPTQLRIADQITRAPDGNYPDPGVAETAKIVDGVVVIQQYQPPGDKLNSRR